MLYSGLLLLSLAYAAGVLLLLFRMLFPSWDFSDPAVAAHEAGHAVVANTLGSKVYRVRIEDPSSGSTDYGRNTNFNLITIALAGLAGESILRPGEPISPIKSSGDFADVKRIFKKWEHGYAAKHRPRSWVLPISRDRLSSYEFSDEDMHCLAAAYSRARSILLEKENGFRMVVRLLIDRREIGYLMLKKAVSGE